MIVCADDYGLRQDIDEAILELCKLGKLSAVSCMVALERCNRALLCSLLAHQTNVDVGLHLCFTDESLPLDLKLKSKLPSFKKLFLELTLRNLNTDQISQLIRQQYDLFVAKTGRPPTHIDGHLHAHQLPNVRDVLVEFVAGLPVEPKPYVRNTRMALRVIRDQKLPWIKASLVGAFGFKMEKMLKGTGLRTNSGFAGIYDFNDWRHYPAYFRKFRKCLEQPNGMMVVHPGLNEPWRRQEFETLSQSLLLTRINTFQS